MIKSGHAILRECKQKILKQVLAEEQVRNTFNTLFTLISKTKLQKFLQVHMIKLIPFKVFQIHQNCLDVGESAVDTAHAFEVMLVLLHKELKVVF